MSWDADLVVEIDGHVVTVGDWNYTHNTSPMIYRVLETVRWPLRPHPRVHEPGATETWWDHLDGMTASESIKYLDTIIGGLNEAPELFRSMNPENGWGDYDSLMVVLAEMRTAAESYPSARWSASG